MYIVESILMALDAIRVNKLRAGLTLLSITIGVFAIMGAGSLVSSIDQTIANEMESLGDRTFYINKMPQIQMGHGAMRKYRMRKDIGYSQFKQLKEGVQLSDMVSAYIEGFGFTIKSGDLETDPDVALVGVDENFFVLYDRPIQFGRPLTETDLLLNRDVAVIGNDIVVKVFPHTNPINKTIRIRNKNFLVVGVMASKGAMMGQSQDNWALIPIRKYLTYYSDEWTQSLALMLRARSKEEIPAAMDEAIGLMRSIRNDKPWQENSFEIESNESLVEQFSGLTKYLSYFGFFCGAIALIAAGVGIMNIMLVSVKERTREIGIRKAIGAKRSWILFQFLVETITLCEVGGILGIILGLGAGLVFSAVSGMSFGVPVGWLLFSLAVCTMLGLSFGMYPAWKASKLDPIDALRYE